MAFCTKCGAEAASDDSFCRKCGAARNAGTPEPEAKAVKRPAPRWLKIFAACAVGFFVLTMIIVAVSPEPEKTAATTVATEEPGAFLREPAPTPEAQTATEEPKSGEEIIAEAPANTPEEERAALRAFCSAFRDAPKSDPALREPKNAMEMMLRADQKVAAELNESIDRANIVVTRVASTFGKGIYGPSECAEALRN